MSPLITGLATLSGSLTRVVGETVGPYAINQGTLTNANYDILFIGNDFIITKQLLTITADNKSKVYGSANPTLTVTYTGLVNGDAAPSTLPTITTTAVASSPVGPYPITASGAADANYIINYVAGILTVSPATLTIIAENKTKFEGAPNPPLTIAYIGFVNGDVALATAPTISTTAVTSSPAGNYPITVNGGALANYIFIYQQGILTVSPSPFWKFEIPNAFIPNDPNVSNKFLKASYNSAVQSVVFKVFNRMGQLVYEVNNQPPSSIQWDGGIAAGKLQEPDGYVWFAELTVLVAGGSKIEHKKGQFLLLK